MSMEAGREARSCRTLQDTVGQAADRRAWNVIRLRLVKIPGRFCCCVRGAVGGNCRTRCLSPNMPGGLYVDRSLGPAGESRPSRVGSPAEQAQKAGQDVGGGQAPSLLLLA